MEQSQNTARPRVGAILREARERMGMSVEEVAIRLKFAPRQIIALEEDNYGQLPQLAFVRGFVRSYARLMQINEAPLLEALPGAPVPDLSPAKRAQEDVLPGIGGARNQNLVWLAGALGVAVVIGVLAWKYDADNAMTKPVSGTNPVVATQEAATTPAASAVQPAGESMATVEPQGSSEKQAANANTGAPAKTPAPAAATTKPAPHPAAPRAASAVSAASGVAANKEAAPRKQRPSQQVRLEFDEDSWVEVKDGNGKILLSMLGKQGTSQTASGPTPISVLIGHAKGVRVYYKNEALDLGTKADQDVVHLKLE